MKTLVDLDAAEADAKARFDAKKAEGAAVEDMLAKGKKAYQTIIAELQKLQGEYEAVQNLRKQAEESGDITSPAPGSDASKEA